MTTMTLPRAHRALIVAGLMSVFVGACAGLCAAADYSDFPAVTVRYSDLNLTNPLGAARLYDRIENAAQQACGSLARDASQKLRPNAKACIHQAIARAVVSIGRFELVAVYNAKNRDPLPLTVAAARSP